MGLDREISATNRYQPSQIVAFIVKSFSTFQWHYSIDSNSVFRSVHKKKVRATDSSGLQCIFVNASFLQPLKFFLQKSTSNSIFYDTQFGVLIYFERNYVVDDKCTGFGTPSQLHADIHTGFEV